MIKLYNIDCVDLMKKYSDNYFDLAIVDPPYFTEYGKKNYTGNDINKKGIRRQTKKINYWKVPDQLYFDQLYRVSKNTIIWGCNYYQNYIKTSGRIIWYKKNLQSTFSKCEIASHSFGVRVDFFAYEWNGMIQQDMKNKEQRIHPTQKPIALYRWILDNYAKKGDKILDTHLGSGSSAIAAHQLGFDFVGSELDKHFFESMQKRVKRTTSQTNIFQTPEERTKKQLELIY